MLAFGVVSLLAAVGVAVATGGRDVRERLTGYEEIPTLSTPANGEFKASVSRFSQKIDYRLSYRGLRDRRHCRRTSTSAHGRSNGGISVFLCSNLAEPAAGHARVPDPATGTVTGTSSSRPT